ncbi:MAG: UbiX family flavin prenyltransferase [Methanomicrobiales archaeon]|nr:UbiX family flavin prenyltransferase [Methanomicrobiales archaeon]
MRVTMENSRGEPRRVVVAVTGASGVIYARRLLDVLGECARVHLVITPAAQKVARIEGVSFEGLPVQYHDPADLTAVIASGSFAVDAMVVIPCSVKTLAAIAAGYAENLVTRAADVCLKERRPVILVLREMPLSRIHIRNMLAADEAGARIFVASPPFYHRPASVQDLVDMVVARVLDHLGVVHTLGSRWGGLDA